MVDTHFSYVGRPTVFLSQDSKQGCRRPHRHSTRCTADLNHSGSRPPFGAPNSTVFRHFPTQISGIRTGWAICARPGPKFAFWAPKSRQGDSRCRHTKRCTADLSHLAADPHLARRIVQFSETFPGKSPQFVQARQFAPDWAPNSHFGRPNRDRAGQDVGTQAHPTDLVHRIS